MTKGNVGMRGDEVVMKSGYVYRDIFIPGYCYIQT